MSSVRTHRLRKLPLTLLLVGGCALLLVGCGGAAPTPTSTLAPAAATPVVAAHAQESPTMATVPITRQPATSAPAALQPEATAWPTVGPEGEGLRPGQARFSHLPDGLLEATAAWRPPPMPVPLSIHPDDHYWLSRPIPSDKRNYDLEWFPYGNDVLLPELYPYRVHRGLDFPNPTGTPILAASSGTVIHAGPLPSGLDGVNYYGNTVIIHHDWQWLNQDVYTLYAHTLELFVEAGDYVEQGELIAGVGRSGIVSGPHLHLEVRIGENNYNNTRNPMLWLAPYEGWGTLAGRLIDIEGRYIYAAWVSVRPLNVEAPIRSQYTYRIKEVNPDERWQENFVFGDLPAGRYEVTVKAAGHEYQNTVEVLPGRTNFVIIQTDFVYTPPTPTPTRPPGEDPSPSEEASGH